MRSPALYHRSPSRAKMLLAALLWFSLCEDTFFLRLRCRMKRLSLPSKHWALSDDIRGASWLQFLGWIKLFG